MTEKHDCCGNPNQCWEPCGELGKSEDHVKVYEAEKQEPVAWRVRWPKIGGGYAWVMNDAPLMEEHGFVNEPLYTSPPQRHPLTFEQVEDCFPDGALFAEADGWLRVSAQTLHDIVRNAEAAHSIKGEA